MAERTSIPVVDLSVFGVQGNAESRVESARALYKTCHDLGFVRIVGHRVEPRLLQEAFDWSKKLLNLYHDKKMIAPHPDGPIPHRDLFSFDSYHPARAEVTRLFSCGAREGVL